MDLLDNFAVVDEDGNTLIVNEYGVRRRITLLSEGSRETLSPSVWRLEDGRHLTPLRGEAGAFLIDGTETRVRRLL